MYPIFLKDKTITFSLRYTDASNSDFFDILPESLVTDYGFFIPSDTDSFNMLDYFDYGPNMPALRFTRSHGLLIDSKGAIRWLSLRVAGIPEESREKDKVYPANTDYLDGYVNSTRVIYYQGMTRSFCWGDVVARMAHMALKIKDNINDVLEFYEAGMTIERPIWHTYNIEDIVNYLKVNRPSKPLPHSWDKPSSNKQTEDQ